MWTEERLQVFEEFDDDWRAGAVLQGATASCEPSFGSLRQRWTTEQRKSVVPTVEASAVHKREVGKSQDFKEEANFADEFSRRVRQKVESITSQRAPVTQRRKDSHPARRLRRRLPGRVDLANKVAATL